MIKTEQTVVFNGQETKVTMFQDAAGTIPVTEYGQPVGLLVTLEPPLCFDGNVNEFENAQMFNELIESLKKT